MPTHEWTYSYENKTVGTLRDGIVYKTVRESRHLFRKLDAWALDWDAWLKWAARGATGIAIYDLDTDKAYRVTAEEFALRAIEIDYGHGVQWALPRKHWEVT